MNDDAPPAISSRSEFAAAVLWGFEQAIACDARTITCVDSDFADWPLNDTALHAQLTSWLRRPQRKLVLLAANYGSVPRRQPRFVAWRALWAHAVDAWVPLDDGAADLPSVLVDDGRTSVQLIDNVHWRGRANLDAGTARLWRDRIDAVLQRSEPGFAVTSLGL